MDAVNTSQGQRSLCPINYALELFGDSWSLLIVRDIVYLGKKTFGEFLSSDEGIARSILANRLKRLEEDGILVKKPNPADRRQDIYALTDKGLDLIPLLLDAAAWSAKHAKTDAPAWWLKAVASQREILLPVIYEAVKNGRSIFGGTDSVASSKNLCGPDVSDSK